MIQHLFDNSEFLQSVFDAVPSFLLIVDSDVRVHHLNAASLSLLETEKGRILFKRCGEVLHCIHASEAPGGCGHAPACRDCVIRNSVTRVFRGGIVHRETTKMLLVTGGRSDEKYFSVTAAPFHYLGELFALLVLEDVTKEKELEEALERRVAERTAELADANEELEAEVAERQKAEGSLARLNRLYSLLSKVNEAIIRIKTPEELYRKVCRIVVEDGGFKMAWIGLLDKATRVVQPVAQWGDTGYLGAIRIVAADVPEGQGPTGRAVFEGSHFICGDIEHDPCMLLWRDKAMANGLRSLAAFPFCNGEAVIGAFTIYSESPEFFSDEETDLLFSLAEDISFAISSMAREKRRQEAEDALKESEERYRSLFNHSLDGILLSSPNGEILAANPEACRILGRTEEEILKVGRSGFLDMSDPEIKRFLEDRARLGKASGEIKCIRKDGERFPCELSSALFRDKNDNIRASTIFRDITEKRRLESIAEALNMMDNIGYVFSGIRHELGNPLNTTKFNLEILKRQYKAVPAEKIGEYIDRAQDGVARIEFLLKSLKSFNLFEEVKPHCVGLQAFLGNFLAMAEADFLVKGIKIKSCLGPGVESAYMDERAFSHALLNVLSNAADALAGAPEPVITVRASRRGDMVSVTVEDNGPGMTGEQMRDLFKPFHTTKPKGTGLGLVIVKKMMSKMKGSIEIRSEKGKGTVIGLYLPAGPPNNQPAD